MIDFKELALPFPPQDIEWRLQECGKKGDKIWAMCLAYITNRAIMQRLDDVVGPDNWKNQYAAGPQGGVVCGLSIRCGDEWVTKWDGADNTQVEATKGGLSDAMKRAGVQWGIGRYLYNLESGFATVVEKGEYRGKTKDGTYFQWNPPKLPSWALPPNAPAAIPKEAPPTPDEHVPEKPQNGTEGDKAGQGEQPPTPTACQAKYRPRLLVALTALHGDNNGAKKTTVKRLTTFTNDEGKTIQGVDDYRVLDGKRLQILVQKVEKEAANKGDLPT